MTERVPRERNAKPDLNKPGLNTPGRNKPVENKPADKQPGAAAVDLPWSVPVVAAEVPETGRHVEFAPDEAARQAIAKVAEVVALPRLKATFDLTRHGAEGLRVEGRVLATVVQNCVVTLEPIESRIDEAVDLVFQPEPGEQPGTLDEEIHAFDTKEPPETLVGGAVDLGALTTEFLILGIDPFPRKENAVFDAPPAGDPSSHPFAALAALKKDSDSQGGTGSS
jgi:uncharacterized metal-binding protein YceD (DUF177 family)